MKFHVHFKDTGETKHYWPIAGRGFLVLEVTPEDRRRIAELPDDEHVIAFATSDWKEEDIQQVLDEIGNYRSVRAKA